MKPKISKIELENYYLKDKLSHKEISKRFLVNPSTIGELLKFYNIPRRRFGEGRIPKGVIKPSKEELENFYITQRLSVMKIAKKIGVAKDTIKHWILNYKLKYRAKGPRKKLIGITKNDLIQLYFIQKLSTRQIAKKYNTAKTIITYWLRKYNLPIRNSKTFNWDIRGITLPSKEQLETDYHRLSLELIAKKYNVSVESILGLFRRYDIKTRNRSEARKLAIQTKRSISWNKGLTMEDPKIRDMVNHLNKMHLAKINESKIKQAETRKKLFADGKLESWNKGKRLSPEHIKKLSEAKKKIANTPEYKAKMREIGLKARPKYKNTKPEKMMKKLLESANLTNGLVEQYPLIFDQLGTKPDFAFPEYKVAIYCDGNYWHGGLHHIGSSLEKIKDGPRKESIKRIMEKDAKQHHTLWRNGWTPLRFWQTDIEKNPEWVIEQIRKNLYDKEHIKKREEQRKELL